jgi:hypothetical protein
MYFVGTAQPHMPAADGPSEETTFYTRDEKRQLADRIAERALELPAVMEHGEAYRHGADADKVTPTPAKVGRVSGAMVDRHGNLVVLGEMFWDAPEARTVIDAVNNKKVRYGLSLASTLERSPGVVHSKTIDHVGITSDPEFGDIGSWLHYGNLTPDGILPRLQELMNEEGMYVPAAMRANLESLMKSKLAAPIASAAPRSVAISASRTTPPPMSDSGASPMDIVPAAAAAAAAVGAPAAVAAPAAATAAAAPAPAPVALGRQRMNDSQRREFEDMRRKVTDRFSVLPPTVDLDQLIEAQLLENDINGLMERAGLVKLADVPSDVRTTMFELSKFQDHLKGLMRKRNMHEAKHESDRLVLDTFVENPAAYRPALLSIAANHNTAYFNNQRAEEEKLRREVEDKKRAEEDKARDETWTKRRRDLDDLEKELTTKRARTDAGMSGLQGPPAAAAATTTTTTLVTTTAARAPNDRITAIRAHWMAQLGPVPWLAPEVADPRKQADESLRNFQTAIEAAMNEQSRNKSIIAEPSGPMRIIM